MLEAMRKSRHSFTSAPTYRSTVLPAYATIAKGPLVGCDEKAQCSAQGSRIDLRAASAAPARTGNGLGPPLSGTCRKA